MKVYYAHPVTLYGSKQEASDLDALDGLWMEIINPNEPEHANGYAARGMSYFESVVADCDVLAFRALADGSIPAGIAQEIQWAREGGLIVIELPSCVRRRVLDVDETREFLKESGRG